MKFGISCDRSRVKFGLSCDRSGVKFGLSCDRSGLTLHGSHAAFVLFTSKSLFKRLFLRLFCRIKPYFLMGRFDYESIPKFFIQHSFLFLKEFLVSFLCIEESRSGSLPGLL